MICVADPASEDFSDRDTNPYEKNDKAKREKPQPIYFWMSEVFPSDKTYVALYDFRQLFHLEENGLQFLLF